MRRWNRALVTGASSGIGEAIARQLGAEGTDLVLVARSKGRLNALASELSSDCEVLAADLTNQGDLARVANRLAETPSIDLLVNNAGFGRTGNFADDDPAQQLSQVDLNVTALVQLSHAGVNAMRNSGGAILNVSSIAGYMPTPDNAIYGATKAFVSSFSHAIASEERNSNVTVTVVAPGFTRTEFQNQADYDSTKIPDALWQSAESVAAAALDATAKGRSNVVPGAHNKAAVVGLRGIPAGLQRKIASLL